MAKKTSPRKGLPKAGSQARYMAESDLSTLKAAEEIRGNLKRFSDAKKVGVAQITNIKKVIAPGKKSGNKKS